MRLPADVKLRAPETVEIRTFDDGESVLLNLKTEHYFSLNATGTRMWQAVTGAASVEAAYQQLLGEYAVDPAELRRDLEDLVAELLHHGLLESDHGG
ncbi:MAG TPA: PqqD family protein [Caldilineaceae bacterium]|nr:PqqD family protein [Caldilineaceae bacterium]